PDIACACNSQCTNGVSGLAPTGSNVLIQQQNQAFAPGMAFLDSQNPNHYGPRGLKQGRHHLDLLATPQCQKRGVSLCPTTRAKRARTGTGRTKRLISPRGSGVSANGSPTRKGRAGKSKLGPVRKAIRRHSPAASGFPPNWSAASRSVP